MRAAILLLSLGTSVVQAWMPSDRSLFGNATQNAGWVESPAGQGRTVKRYLPASGKIRGVNLGALFIVEPWMASQEWSQMGCGSANSEFDCVSALGQSAANSAFQGHWSRWITQDDITTISSYGLNTIRIPVGYWMDESTVYGDSEHFPQGGIDYLEKVCGWASDQGE
jgi:glucan endo-1,6-beta-glucosidase